MKALTILIPTRPQPDTLVAIFLLKTFFPPAREVSVEVRATLNPEDTFEGLLEKNSIALDLGGFILDHHGKDVCTSQLVAQYLGIEGDPSIARLLQYAKRDDQEGKGTASNDPIDRAFGLSGLVASLNKTHPGEPQKVIDAVMPLLEAHLAASKEHHVELPKEVEVKKARGEYDELSIKQGHKNLKAVFIVSDKPSMPTYLRSYQGPRADVVLQKAEKTNHFCVLTRQERKIDLSKLAALIRLRESELTHTEVSEAPEYLGKTGRIDEIPYWYYDPATNSLLNGGPHNPQVKESSITWDEIKKIVKLGLEIGGKKN